MNINLIGAGVVNSLKPFCRKHVIESLEESEFALLNTIMILFLLLGYIIYSKKSIKKICFKYYNLTWMQICAITALSLITVIGSMLKLSFYKQNNPTFRNEMIVKGITSAIIIFIGIIFYNEAYTWKTFLGIGMISLGLYLL